ncbi:MAG: hypothetical protein JW891_13085 [Candidatus Lokiarchaeota archaeon]|nr:hypothetical protein [Candidatus Lokiarchaeota archaeon]
MMYDIAIIGAGIAGASLARKASEYANTLLIEAREENNLLVATNIFSEHNKPFLTEVDYSNKSIFPLLHEKMNYMGSTDNGEVNSSEFGAPFGHIIHTEELVKKLYQTAVDKGATTKFGERVSKIENRGDYVEIINNKGESYKSKLVAIATGSSGLELQRSVGFEVPDCYQGIFTHLRGDQDVINSQLPYHYIFHINPKISTNGPFYIEKGFERVPIGFMGNSNESPASLVDKLNRILHNYQRIQPFIKNLKVDEKPVILNISKHPIKQFSRDRMVVLGEAAGLVTSFFYEGMLCGVCSADLISKICMSLLENDSSFNRNDLQRYDRELHRILIDNYNQNGTGSEYLFYNAGSHVKVLWDTYVKLINTDKQLRKEIWEAYRMPDIENYDLKGTKRAGKNLFSMLPALTKIALSGKFLRAAFM